MISDDLVKHSGLPHNNRLQATRMKLRVRKTGVRAKYSEFLLRGWPCSILK